MREFNEQLFPNGCPLDFLKDMRQLFSVVGIINFGVHEDYVRGLLSNESLINDAKAYVPTYRLVMHRHGRANEKLYIHPWQYR